MRPGRVHAVAVDVLRYPGHNKEDPEAPALVLSNGEVRKGEHANTGTHKTTTR